MSKLFRATFIQWVVLRPHITEAIFNNNNNNNNNMIAFQSKAVHPQTRNTRTFCLQIGNLKFTPGRPAAGQQFEVHPCLLEAPAWLQASQVVLYAE